MVHDFQILNEKKSLIKIYYTDQYLAGISVEHNYLTRAMKETI
jgi:hypothetical protein